MIKFDIIFDRIFGNEGGYVNNPKDPGRETNWGISKRSYPNIDIKNLSKKDAKDIYFTNFWSKIEADYLHQAVAYQLMDFAVNSGIETAIRYFQRAVGVADDGNFGPISQKAAENMSDTDIILNLNAERLEFMTKLKNWPDAGRGWANRIARNLRYGSLDT